MGTSIAKMNVSVTLHVSFFTKSLLYQSKNCFPSLLLTPSNIFCLIEYCFSNNPQILQMTNILQARIQLWLLNATLY